MCVFNTSYPALFITYNAILSLLFIFLYTWFLGLDLFEMGFIGYIYLVAGFTHKVFHYYYSVISTIRVYIYCKYGTWHGYLYIKYQKRLFNLFAHTGCKWYPFRINHPVCRKVFRC